MMIGRAAAAGLCQGIERTSGPSKIRPTTGRSARAGATIRPFPPRRARIGRSLATTGARKPRRVRRDRSQTAGGTSSTGFGGAAETAGRPRVGSESIACALEEALSGPGIGQQIKEIDQDVRGQDQDRREKGEPEDDGVIP